MSQTNLVGKVILGYTVIEKLGSGAFGTVYKVQKENPSGTYIRALKHITIPTEKQYYSVLNSMGGDVSKTDNYFSEMLKSIVSEISILNMLSEKGEKHIIRYYENDIKSVESPKRYDVFILMEYLTPLEEYISHNSFLVSDVGKLGIDILHGLISCHNSGIIHRDIKDDNIFVSEAGEYKIGDFGVSKILKDSSKAESLKGTPNYLAPEVYLGKESYTKNVDLYSLGIVLYRLLNYNRNPFLPQFPKQYLSHDEDIAFEARMNGKQPDLPLLGGELIGNVLIKAISNKENRFQSASDFLNEWENALRNTNSEILQMKVTFANNMHNKYAENTLTKHTATLAETPFSKENTVISQNNENSINKHLFESVGDTIPDSSNPIINNVNNEQYSNTANNVYCNHLIDTSTSSKKKQYTNKAFNIKAKRIIIFLLPIAIILLGIIAYLIVIPHTYRKAVSFIDWLFSNPQNIIDTLREPNTVLPKLYNIIGLRICRWIWLASFITSLFFVGRQLQYKTQHSALNAIFIDREPYFAIQDLDAKLKVIRLKINCDELEEFYKSVKQLEEHLSIESDFGYGDDSIISCENDIASQIQFLLASYSNIEAGNVTSSIQPLNEAILNINTLLQRRTELKKK